MKIRIFINFFNRSYQFVFKVTESVIKTIVIFYGYRYIEREKKFFLNIRLIFYSDLYILNIVI